MRLGWPWRERGTWNHPWYHDFTPLGIPTPQAAGTYRQNQIAKQDQLFGYIREAITLCGKERPRGLELFCADGFYSHFAVQAGAGHVLGVDLGERQSAGEPIHLDQARLMAKKLGHKDRTTFQRQDVFDVTGQFDFAICAGGLYHLEDPERLLRKVRQQVKGPLVVQTVYSLAHGESNYFESPAPGWTWGCRFSLAYLLEMFERTGWRVLKSSSNILEGNARLEDRGSVYALAE